MKKVLIAITLLLLITGLTADAQWRSDTHDEYHALQRPAEITIDGQLDDAEGWEGVFESVTGENGDPFCEVEFAGNDGKIYVFREWDGGNWDGRDDHRTCFGIVWDEENIYLALAVTDDEHQNGGGAWNGDSAQIGFVPSGMRKPGAELYLYNAALNNDANGLIFHNEAIFGAQELTEGDNVAITRNEDDKETYYEYRFSADDWDVAGGKFSAGYEFGLAICVNDGDKDTPGQKGWSGWYTDCIVNGAKQPENTGLVILTDEQLAVEAKNKLTTTWGRLKSTR